MEIKKKKAFCNHPLQASDSATSFFFSRAPYCFKTFLTTCNLKERLYFILECSQLTLVIDSGEKQRDSALHIHVFIPIHVSKRPFLPGFHIEQNSMFYTIDLCWLSILNIAVCTCPSLTPFQLSLPPILPPGNYKLVL